ncbi:universal stress protein, partial [bacterium]|nr:universal stress protein [candidate division CSSED10-310 bacterium]
MLLVRRILVPVDYSAPAARAVQLAAALAEDLQAQLFFLHVREASSPSSATGDDDLFGGLGPEYISDDMLAGFVRMHGAPGIFSMLAGHGVPASVIVSAVDLLDIDLV